MVNEKTLDSWLHQYAQMDRMTKTVKKRMDELNKNIKKELIEEEPDEDGHIRYTSNNYKVVLQIKRSIPNICEGALQQMLLDKGLWNEAKMNIVDRNKVKQLWIEGKLSDNDLRSISNTKDPQTALKVEPCTKEK